jgi:hypothetical protein
MEIKRQEKNWLRGFFTTMIVLRYCLTPIGTVGRAYTIGNLTLRYLDIYVFGIKIARLSK